MAIATRDKRADEPGKVETPDELCTTTAWHRDRARKIYWAVLGMPARRRLAPPLPDLVPES